MSGKPQRKLKKDLPDIWGIKKTKMIDTAFIIFLRGVATQKGIEIIDDFFKENNI